MGEVGAVCSGAVDGTAAPPRRARGPCAIDDRVGGSRAHKRPASCRRRVVTPLPLAAAAAGAAAALIAASGFGSMYIYTYI